MASSDVQLFTLLGFRGNQLANERKALIADFLSGGLGDLQHMSIDDVKDACNGCAKRTDAPFPIILTQLQRKKFKALVLWVKDMVRAQQPMEFPNRTTGAQLNVMLDAMLLCHERRKEQKKVGQSLCDHKFNNKLKSQAQWEKFSEELEATLATMIGAQGVTLLCVICADEVAVFDPAIPCEQAVTQAAPLAGPEFDVDAQTVHTVILNNVHEDSDAHTCIKPLLRYRNGRQDVIALCKRHFSDVTKQAIINAAKNVLETIRYKNERSFSFERFSAKFQKAHDDLARCGQPVDNGDIVNSLWDMTQDAGLQTHLAALKVEYHRNSRDYKLILQDIAAEVASKKPVNLSGRTSHVNAIYTREGDAPKSGVHAADGSIFVASYDSNKWRSEEVKKHHAEILEARSREGGGKKSGPSRNEKRDANAIKRQNRQIKKLKAKIKVSAARLKKAGVDGGDEDDGKEESDANAGDSFGGKNSKKKKE